MRPSAKRKLRRAGLFILRGLSFGLVTAGKIGKRDVLVRHGTSIGEIADVIDDATRSDSSTPKP
jgi:hypothetical protein